MHTYMCIYCSPLVGEFWYFCPLVVRSGWLLFCSDFLSTDCSSWSVFGKVIARVLIESALEGAVKWNIVDNQLNNTWHLNSYLITTYTTQQWKLQVTLWFKMSLIKQICSYKLSWPDYKCQKFLTYNKYLARLEVEFLIFYQSRVSLAAIR